MKFLVKKFRMGIQRLQLFFRVGKLNRGISAGINPNRTKKPVVFFNASARLEGLNLNAAFNLIASWGIQLAGREVYHFACRSGLSRCVLGAGLGNPTDPPPCQGCIQYTNLFTSGAQQIWFDFHPDSLLDDLLEGKSVSELEKIVYQERPLGELVLTSLRWILRRHHLENDPATIFLFREFIRSAHSIADEFSSFLDKIDPEAVVIFNGLQYPEAAVAWVAKNRGIRVITHEVNLQPFSAFFTEGQATIYPLDIPEDFRLSPDQDQLLDDYLEKRFRGDFKMAGVKFWSEMDHLPASFLEYAGLYQHLVPVFTNVIFDTSQAHANTIFSQMFEWLDLVVETADRHPESLFVIRAHPDEMRAGKSSQESVTSWAEKKALEDQPNILLINPDETFSSYELIQRSKFCLVYNSSIGLEAALLGKAVLCAGKARYTPYNTVIYPDSRSDYQINLEKLLNSPAIDPPPHFRQNARKFLFFQLFRSALIFKDYLKDHLTPGYVQLSDFNLEDLKPGSSKLVDVIVNGILNRKEFLMETDQ